jgi:NAD-dependent SIR2 family protein deacetylase
MATMTMIENPDFSISWECSECLETFKDSKDFDSDTKKCPGCKAKITEFIYLYEDEDEGEE